MASESQRVLKMGALVIPIFVAAAGGKWAVDAIGTKGIPSASLPTPQELDSLRGYVVRTTPPAPAPSPSVPAYAVGGSDPFAKVDRWETPRYVADGGIGTPARTLPPRWIVSTIMITESRRVAVVNGSLVSPGTLLPGGARVLSIEPDHVVIAEPSGARREVAVQGGAN